ncbi:MAG: hypothetical protein ACI92S_005652, partial [Planctomycetaceae bacterium]
RHESPLKIKSSFHHQLRGLTGRQSGAADVRSGSPAENSTDS